MANHRPLGQIIPFSHLPTWLFVIGYPLFWVQLNTHAAPDGVTSPLSWAFLSIIAACSLYAGSWKFPRLAAADKLFWLAGACVVFVMMVIVTIAAFKPIHLMQEFDCMQYHYTLPRQHLILGSFVHIPWAADDLFLLPMDFALSPFWFATLLPNKIPQLILFFGLLAVAMNLTTALVGEKKCQAPWLVAMLILGTHGFAIQMGTGMLDLGIAYLFLASLDSLYRGNWFLAGIEFCFFFWSKPLMPLGVTAICSIYAIIFVLATRNGWKMVDSFEIKEGRKAFVCFAVLSILVGGPFVVKSLAYAGTPFFPWAPGIMGQAEIKSNPQAWQSLGDASRSWMIDSKNGYGHGRGVIAFLKHWWLVAVPEHGVNNSFDYPLGLTYLLMIGPFLFLFVKSVSRREFSPLAVLSVMTWTFWWFGAQQSRFLYLPLLLIFIVTVSRLEKIARGLLICILLSLGLETASLYGAHKADFNKWGRQDLRAQDRELVELSTRYHQKALISYIDWPSHDVAYAQFPVLVRQENLPHTVRF